MSRLLHLYTSFLVLIIYLIEHKFNRKVKLI
nr:MAG TPA: hypothetical protein [Caudoviricetes sp.]